jgi:hypothetical protein
MSGTGSLSILSAVAVVPFSSPSAKNGTPSIHLMQHFQRNWAKIFHMPCIDEIMSLSKSYPLVLNTILAITACHLRHVSPGVLQYRIAEHFQQALALRDYQRVLCTPLEELGQSGANALLLSAALLNILAFALPESEIATGGSCGAEPDPSTSWVFSPREDRLGWLALQVGLRTLIRSMTAYLEESLSFLGPIFLGTEKESWAFGGAGRSLEGIPERWIEIFELNHDTGTAKTMGGQYISAARRRPGDVFRPPVAILVRLRDLEPTRKNVFKNLQFLGKMQPQFRAWLYERDERALWLFGYWLGLLCRFEGVWWCDMRVRRDYKAIVIFLEQLRLAKRTGAEGETWREMMKDLESAPVFART